MYYVIVDRPTHSYVHCVSSILSALDIAAAERCKPEDGIVNIANDEGWERWPNRMDYEP